MSQFALTFISEGLPGFTVGEPQDFDLQVSGGTPPYRFAITKGRLPAGLTLSTEGKITGAVTNAEPDRTVFIEVTDADQAHLTQAFDVQVTTPDRTGSV